MMFKNFCWALRQKPSQWPTLNYVVIRWQAFHTERCIL